MFENFGTALIQLIGFLGVFVFFVFQLLSENKFFNLSSKDSLKKQNEINTKINSKRKGIFGKKIVEPVEEKITPKKRWFK